MIRLALALALVRSVLFRCVVHLGLIKKYNNNSWFGLGEWSGRSGGWENVREWLFFKNITKHFYSFILFSVWDF